MGRNLIMDALDAGQQHLIIMPTERCNFRCTYCYEDFEIGRMKPEIVSGVKNLIAKRANSLKTLRISWFGGEPLLALSVVREIMHSAIDLSEKLRFKLKSSMTTNGYLLDSETFRELNNIWVREFQITLDGPEATHNKSRLRADGAGTYEKIMRNIESAANSTLDFKITLRIHYSPTNWTEMPELLKVVSDICKNDDRFNVHLKPIENLGGENGQRVEKWPLGMRGELHKKFAEMLPASKVLEFDEYICYASKPNSLVIRADGSLSKCTVAFSDPNNSIGQLKQEGLIDVDNEKLSYWIRGLISNDQEVLACPATSAKRETNFIPIRSLT